MSAAAAVSTARSAAGATAARPTAARSVVAGTTAVARAHGRQRDDFRKQILRDRCDRDLASDVRLDVRQRHDVLLAAEADRVAFGAGARRATDAVNVVLRVLRQVIVEDVTDIRD